ncbi:hypothetical protein M0R45_019445 [Rubus argutus]|uniref:Uncharacterized protein n=1 Tax=Rubus argutus TaxID=59490 RepID=A0AAW1X5D0_RUBAR
MGGVLGAAGAVWSEMERLHGLIGLGRWPALSYSGGGNDSDNENEDCAEIKITEEYARRYEHNKNREDLQRFEELKKRGLVEDDDPDSEEDDDDNDDDDGDVFANSQQARLGICQCYHQDKERVLGCRRDDGDDGDGDGEFLRLKDKDVAEKKEDNAEFEKKLDEYFGDDLDDNARFLRDFFKNKMWMQEGGSG